VHEYDSLTKAYSDNFRFKREGILNMIGTIRKDNPIEIRKAENQIKTLRDESKLIRNEVKQLIRKTDPGYDTNDTDYVFLTFIMTYLPKGVIGLLIAVIFSAAMSSSAGELNALASTTTVDFYKRIISAKNTDKHYVVMSKIFTAFWGTMTIMFALLANQAENLIQAVNIVGSLFYGTILGIFISAFFFKILKGSAVFTGAILAEFIVIILHFLTVRGLIHIGYLWYNAIGLVFTIIFGLIIQTMIKK
jgi:Na+/proline symporter